jgi:PKD domain/Immunoglobulin I-set domain
VFGNTIFSGSTSNTANITFCRYSCTIPSVSGLGNIAVDPLLLADGVHLSSNSPCRAAGINTAVSGADIDGQSWSNPPSIGCDEWQPMPVIGAQPTYQINSPAYGLTFNVIAAGQTPFVYFWGKDGTPVQDNGHRINSGTANLVINNFVPDDAGLYQVIVSNTFGVVTSQVAQVVIHTVDAAGANPVAPYSTWATAATNIQDAINIAAAGDIVLVTNGVYATGGKVEAGDLTNRVAVDKPITVTSVNGYAATVIKGAGDPTSTNGPGAVRCAWLTDGATLNGFTLLNGATRATGNTATLQSGGGVWCVSTNGVVSNCLLTNNTAIYGGGISYGTLNNCLVVFNLAVYGGGAYYATLNNCTVLNNYTTTIFLYRGGGTYDCVVRNSIVLGNADNWPSGSTIDNYYYDGGYFLPKYSYSCTYPLISGTGNIDGNSFNPQILDSFHIASTSPCHGAGSVLYTSGADLDGEPWANPPSMGCDEVIVANLVGPLSVSIFSYQTNLLVNRPGFFSGMITGRASRVEWSFGDGPTVTNRGAGAIHQWTTSGDYAVTFTAFNTDNPAGVSTNFLIHVLPLNPPQLQSALLLTNGFQFQFTGQLNANYTVQYTTNLAPPATWQTLQNIYYSNGGVHQITDSTLPNGTRFYRVLAQ